MRSYDAQDGSKRYVTEVVADEVEFLSPRDSGEFDSFAPPQSGNRPSGDMQSVQDDDLPF